MPQQSVTLHEHELITALKERGDWMSRGELAQILGKRRLWRRDTLALERLAELGLIEMRVYRMAGQGVVVDYRAKA